MPSGGFRPGAGRKKGSVSKMSEGARAIALAGGQSPLDYLLSVMRDINNDLSTRLDAAKAAAPFLHAKLSTVALSADVTHNVISSEPMSAEDWEREYAQPAHH